MQDKLDREAKALKDKMSEENEKRMNEAKALQVRSFLIRSLWLSLNFRIGWVLDLLTIVITLWNNDIGALNEFLDPIKKETNLKITITHDMSVSLQICKLLKVSPFRKAFHIKTKVYFTYRKPLSLQLIDV